MCYVNNNLSNCWSLSGIATEIPNDSDMNTYMTPGNFMCATNNGVKTLKNCPVDNAFMLKVSSPINSKNYVMQEYIDLAGIQVIRTYSAYDKTWVEKRNATTNDLPNIFTAKLGTSNQEGNHATTIKGLWNSFPEKQVFACHLVDSNNFCVFGFIYDDHKYGTVLYLAYNSCGIVKCADGTFSDMKL